MTNEWQQEQYSISTDKARFDIKVIHGYLSRSYWAEGIPVEIVSRSIEHSLCFGVYCGDDQVGFARVITDYATFGYLADVFIIEEHQGHGLGKWLMEVITSHPQLQGFRKWMLATRDAHALYRKFGFVGPGKPESIMEIARPGLYLQKKDFE
jgi:GNAT superfamily N-acetyltransferase